MNVANALEAEFSLEEQASIEKAPTESPEAYRLFLAALEAGGRSAFRIDLLSRAIEIDPNFALAYVHRAIWYVAGLNRFLGAPGGASRVAERESLARQDLDKVLALDSDFAAAAAYVVTARIASNHWRGVDARDSYEQAYRLSANDTLVLGNYAIFSAEAGEYEDAIRLEQRALQLDPSRGFGSLAYILEHAKRLDDAAARYREELILNPESTTAIAHYSSVEKVRGNYAEAEEALRGLDLPNTVPVILAQAAYVYALIGLQRDAEIFITEFEQRAVDNRQSAASWVMVSLAKGDEEQALHWLNIAAEKAPYEGYTTIHRIKANLWEDPVLDQREFLELREQLGFTDL
jgi:Tfp pilus assembly protein PilF